MSPPYLIPATIGMIIPILQIRKQTWAITRSFEGHTAGPEPSVVWLQSPHSFYFPGFPLPPLLLLSDLSLGFSSYQGKELTSGRVPVFKAASHGG